MWLLQWLPHWAFYALLIVGVIGYIVSLVMRVISIGVLYRTPIQIISAILIAVGIYMSGAISNEESWQLKVKEMEAKVAEAEAKSAKENIKIVEKIVRKQKVIKERGEEITKYIDREIVKYDSKCEIPQEVVKVINDAAESADAK